MFARISSLFLFFLFALPILAAANAIPRTDPPVSQCNTGPIQCCNSVQQANANGLASLLGLLGIVLGPITGLIGLNCSPIGIGGGSSCTAQPVCCTNNQFNGLVNLGCSPINIGL